MVRTVRALHEVTGTLLGRPILRTAQEEDACRRPPLLVVLQRCLVTERMHQELYIYVENAAELIESGGFPLFGEPSLSQSLGAGSAQTFRLFISPLAFLLLPRAFCQAGSLLVRDSAGATATIGQRTTEETLTAQDGSSGLRTTRISTAPILYRFGDP